MKATDIHQLVTLAEKMNYKANIVTTDIFGKHNYRVDYKYYQIDDNRVYYDKDSYACTKDVVAVQIGK